MPHSKDLFDAFTKDLNPPGAALKYVREGTYKSTIYSLPSTFVPTFDWEIKFCMEDGHCVLNSVAFGNGNFASLKTGAHRKLHGWKEVEKRALELRAAVDDCAGGSVATGVAHVVARGGSAAAVDKLAASFEGLGCQ